MAQKKAAPKSAAKGKPEKGKPAGRVGLTRTRLRKMIANLMETLEGEGGMARASVSELLKLLQVYNDMTAGQVKEVEVRWVDRLRPEEDEGGR